MRMHPTSIYRPMPIGEIKQIAIGRRLGVSDTSECLFTGGERPLMIFLNGERAGHAYDLKQAGQAAFLVIEDVEFEVDPNSYYRPRHVEEPVGALLVTDAGLAITAYLRRDDWPAEVTDIYFNQIGDGGPSRQLDQAGFTRWRAVKRLGNQIHEIVSFESSAVGDR